MQLIIVQGGGASGKSTLAKAVSNAVGIPVFAKDQHKQSQINRVGKKLSPTKWLQQEGQSYDGVCEAIKSAVKNNKSLIVEGNFHRSHRKELQAAARGCPNIVEIVCYTRGFIAAKRYIKRNKRDGNPEGYKDLVRYAVVILEATSAKLGLGWYKSLGLSDKVLKFDASDLSKIDYGEVIDFTKSVK